MMFSSNQILELSGDLDDLQQLEYALKFALKYSGEEKNMLKSEIDRGCKLVYQITKDGKYCIGWGFESVPYGWLEYPFTFNVKKVCKIIRKHLEEISIEEVGIFDGSYSKGFIMKCIGMNSAEKIENPFYGIVYFKPYTCFYAK